MSDPVSADPKPVLNYKQPPSRQKLVDVKSHELAEHFCQDDPRHKPYVKALSEAIQEAVEDFLTSVDYELDDHNE